MVRKSVKILRRISSSAFQSKLYFTLLLTLFRRPSRDRRQIRMKFARPSPATLSWLRTTQRKLIYFQRTAHTERLSSDGSRQRLLHGCQTSALLHLLSGYGPPGLAENPGVGRRAGYCCMRTDNSLCRLHAAPSVGFLILVDFFVFC